MKIKVRRIIILLSIAIFIFIFHLLYSKFIKGACETDAWFQMYIKEQEYFVGISYALSFAFIAFAFLKFKENRKAALKTALGGGLWAIILWIFCFLFGCCSSPMLIVYLNLIGLSGLKVPKFFLLLMTIVFISIGYLWLIRKSKSCCDSKSSKKD